MEIWIDRRKDLHHTTHNIHNRQKSMPPVGLETANSASLHLHIYNLDRVTPGIGTNKNNIVANFVEKIVCFS